MTQPSVPSLAPRSPSPSATGNRTESSPPSRPPLAPLAELGTIRSRCAAVTRSIADGRSSHFRLDLSALDPLVSAAVRLAVEPALPLNIPPAPAAEPIAARTDRWAALQAGGIDRIGSLRSAFAHLTPTARLRAEADLVVMLALLDSEAAHGWSFEERGQTVDALALPLARHDSADLFALLDRFGSTPAVATTAAGTSSEQPAAAAKPSTPSARWRGSAGLAIATLQAFRAGVFSSSREEPCRVDARALAQMDGSALRAAFQVGAANTLPGLDARAAALSALGRRLADLASRGGSDRPSRWLAPWLDNTGEHAPVVDVQALLGGAVQLFGPIFVQSPAVLGLRVGDAWSHAWAGMDAPTSQDPHGKDRGTGGWVPFHLGLQSMVRSLASPWRDASAAVDASDAGQAAHVAAPPTHRQPPLHPLTDLHRLTDTSSERHVAWLFDAGVLVPRSPRDLMRVWPPGEAIVVEARAAAVHLFDILVGRVAEAGGGGQGGSDGGIKGLGRAEARRHLDQALALDGRTLAQERRGGAPVLMVQPDAGLW